MDERKKHGWAWWCAAGAIVVPVLYFASFGPACQYINRTGTGGTFVTTIYSPLLGALHSHKLPRWIDKPLRNYYHWWEERSD